MQDRIHACAIALRDIACGGRVDATCIACPRTATDAPKITQRFKYNSGGFKYNSGGDAPAANGSARPRTDPTAPVLLGPSVPQPCGSAPANGAQAQAGDHDDGDQPPPDTPSFQNQGPRKRSRQSIDRDGGKRVSIGSGSGQRQAPVGPPRGVPEKLGGLPLRLIIVGQALRQRSHMHVCIMLVHSPSHASSSLHMSHVSLRLYMNNCNCTHGSAHNLALMRLVSHATTHGPHWWH